MWLGKRDQLAGQQEIVNLGGVTAIRRADDTQQHPPVCVCKLPGD